MKKILFVCMGNICRSPAAEGIMKQKIKAEGLDKEILVDSAGTLDYHVGELPDERMRKHASERGYDLNSRGRHFNPDEDFEKFDMIITMDDENYDYVNRKDKRNKYSDKVHKLVEFSSDKSLTEVPDPYYGGNKGFINVLNILEDATDNLLAKLKSEIENEH